MWSKFKRYKGISIGKYPSQHCLASVSLPGAAGDPRLLVYLAQRSLQMKPVHTRLPHALFFPPTVRTHTVLWLTVSNSWPLLESVSCLFIKSFLVLYPAV